MANTYEQVILSMCRNFHEERYQAQMDFSCLLLVLVIGYFGWPIIKAHINTMKRDEEQS